MQLCDVTCQVRDILKSWKDPPIYQKSADLAVMMEVSDEQVYLAAEFSPNSSIRLLLTGQCCERFVQQGLLKRG